MRKARRLGVHIYSGALQCGHRVAYPDIEYVEGPSVKDVFLEFGLGGGRVASEIVVIYDW
ncbi:hypothetical protein RchiOBHm_Chr5g0022281 [Rosa chinensis]|uniref:Uncharacterized protein n=1 Tax=Rosa chinensis TaxID=74649 RepID=A0A2P6Q7T2_ROSCH|nr:hypothetical protein RchiOBHm_Chr5g0022281 [Rosa chinensis]